MDLGIVGLGKMGGSFAIQAKKKNYSVVGISKPPIAKELKDANIKIVDTYAEFVDYLTPPRKIIISVPAGHAVDAVINELSEYLAKGDIIMDCGNSYYKDSVNRQKMLKERGFNFVDVGSSGGPKGALDGACFMVGGLRDVVEKVRPVLANLAVPEGFFHAGPPGAGHFVKIIHNAIEFGMLQAIGEGVSLLKNSEYEIDLPGLFHNWAHGSVIRGWLIELMEQGLREGLVVENIEPYVEDTGEVNWVVEEAICREIPIPNISQAVWALMQSRDKDQYASKTVALLRHMFGGHPFGHNSGIAKERTTGKVVKGTCR